MVTKSSHLPDGGAPEIFVYCLTFPNGKCYVGVSLNMARRALQHQKNTEAFAMEKKFILKLNTKCPHGYNMTNGGEGIVGRSEASRKASGEKLSARYDDPAFRQEAHLRCVKAGPKVSKANKAFYATPEGKDVMRKRSTSAWKENIAEANRNHITPELKKKLSKIGKALWKDPEHRAKVNGAREKKQAELRETDWLAKKSAKQGNTMKDVWKDPAYLAKMKMRKKPKPPSHEEAVRRGAKASQSWTPEMRAAHGEKTRLRYVALRASQAALSQGKKK